MTSEQINQLIRFFYPNFVTIAEKGLVSGMSWTAPDVRGFASMVIAYQLAVMNEREAKKQEGQEWATNAK